VVELQHVEVGALDPVRLEPVIGVERYDSLRERAEAFRVWLGATRVWNVNSTATGGGVAEMLQVLVGYSLGLGLDVRWEVIPGDAAFFVITKRLHNRIHGVPGDTGVLGEAEATHYRAVAEANAWALLGQVRKGDVVILHDPQTAGMAAVLSEAGVHVVWRCHIGADRQNLWTAEAWEFLRPHVEAASAVVFTRSAYVPTELSLARVAVIPPSIDPFSPKNRPLAGDMRRHILRRIGVLGPSGQEPPVPFTRRDGSTGEITRAASVVSEGSSLDTDLPLVVQVSRWDRLKDMQGVMRGFAANVAEEFAAELALVGPAAEGVTDDPEGAEVWAECLSEWEQLPAAIRRRIRLISLPMQDTDENAVMVNAIQTQATVIVQKSLVEAFGLTVSEGMWKAKAVVASAVGGIIDQVGPGTGILLDDPGDLDAFGAALRDLLARPDRIEQLGVAAKRHVIDNFIGDVHLLRYAALIEDLMAG
jgi:trehalose synthase